MIVFNEYFLSFIAGLISFFSPCILPLFPVYLSTLNQNSVSSSNLLPRKLLFDSLLFVLSFTSIFILLALTSTSIGIFLNLNKLVLLKIAGSLIIIFGSINIIALYLPNFYKNFSSFKATSNKTVKPFLMGICFGLAWTPCVGPILASIVSYSAIEANYKHSIIMLFSYSLGLGIPFIAGSLGLMKALTRIGKNPLFLKYYGLFMSLILIFFGVLVFTNSIYLLNVYIQKMINIFTWFMLSKLAIINNCFF